MSLLAILRHIVVGDFAAQARPVAIADHRIAGHILQGQLVFLTQRMIARQNAHQSADAKRHHLQVVVFYGHAGDTQVGFMSEQLLAELLVIMATERELDVRILMLKLCERQRNKALPDARTRNEVQYPAAISREHRHQIVDALHTFVDVFDFAIQSFGFRRRIEPILNTLKQRKADTLLGMRQKSAYRWLRYKKHL